MVDQQLNSHAEFTEEAVTVKVLIFLILYYDMMIVVMMMVMVVGTYFPPGTEQHILLRWRSGECDYKVKPTSALIF